MRPLRAALIYVAAVLVCGALVAPWAYHFAQASAENLPGLAQQPFHRFVNRAILVAALVGLWPFLRAVGLNSGAALGLTGQPHQLRRLTVGLLVGVGTVVLVAGCVFVAGARRLDPALAGPGWLPKLVGIVGTAAVVGTLEEVLFRGALFGALRKVWHWTFALGISSVLFAVAHFIQSARWVGSVGWASGFIVLGRMFEGFCCWHRVMPAFVNLVLVGVALGVAYHRTGSLHFSIGLHAGWIFALKLYGWLTAPTAQPATWWWGTHKFVDGWFALPVLVAVCLGLIRVFRGRERRSPYAGVIF